MWLQDVKILNKSKLDKNYLFKYFCTLSVQRNLPRFDSERMPWSRVAGGEAVGEAGGVWHQVDWGQERSKTKNVTKLKKLKMWQKSKTQNVTKLKTQNVTKKIKIWQLKNLKCDKTKKKLNNSNIKNKNKMKYDKTKKKQFLTNLIRLNCEKKNSWTNNVKKN